MKALRNLATFSSVRCSQLDGKLILSRYTLSKTNGKKGTFLRKLETKNWVNVPLKCSFALLGGKRSRSLWRLHSP